MKGAVAIQEGRCLQKDDFKLFAEYIISTYYESSNVSLFENIFFHNKQQWVKILISELDDWVLNVFIYVVSRGSFCKIENQIVKSILLSYFITIIFFVDHRL